ncbi:MAG: CBS domain-containing protein [Candidatus Bathyarchaeota archaeon]|nr:MAG: CBS domain-containing protein [Candidatus Bathyarchaeota archaeon]
MPFGWTEVDIEEIMVRNVVCVEADSTVRDAVVLMNLHGIGCLIVAHRERVLGIITERDVLKRVVAHSKDPDKTKVLEIMSRPIIVGGPDMFIEDATKLMLSRNIKKLPITKNDRIVGIVTLSDIARAANVEPKIVGVIEDLKKAGWLPTRKMEKVVDFYVA